VQVPYSPRPHRVLGFRYMQFRTRLHRTPTCDYFRLPSLPLDDLRALTLLSPHLDIHTLSTDNFMTLRFSNERTYLRLFQKFILLTQVCLRPQYVTPLFAA
jgi:hypothetical protein